MELGERNPNIKFLLKKNSLCGSILQSLLQFFLYNTVNTSIVPKLALTIHVHQRVCVCVCGSVCVRDSSQRISVHSNLPAVNWGFCLCEAEVSGDLPGGELSYNRLTDTGHTLFSLTQLPQFIQEYLNEPQRIYKPACTPVTCTSFDNSIFSFNSLSELLLVRLKNRTTLEKCAHLYDDT